MPRMLIVDDDSVDREQALRCLASIPDLETREASNGRDAIAACLETPPDIVLTDLRMPDLDGLGLVQEIRQRLPLVAVILMTARGSEQIAAAALEAGAVSYVPKSDMAELLVETVLQALEVSGARRERAAVLHYLKASRSEFELVNDPTLITPLVAYLQDDLERIGFADDRIRSQIGTALVEAITNAMIHGNLEVGSELRLESTLPYHQLITERGEREPWSRRVVTCRSEHKPESVAYVIRDQGPGFDRSTLPDPTKPESMLRAQGRGLFLMHAFMDTVEYNEAGNEVRMTKRADPPA